MVSSSSSTEVGIVSNMESTGYRHCQAPRQEGAANGPQERGSLPLAPRQGSRPYTITWSTRLLTLRFLSSSTDSLPAARTQALTRLIVIKLEEINLTILSCNSKRSSSTVFSFPRTTALPFLSPASPGRPQKPLTSTPKLSSKSAPSPMISA